MILLGSVQGRGSFAPHPVQARFENLCSGHLAEKSAIR